MMANQITHEKKIADIGEDIGLEAGQEMVKIFAEKRPNDVSGWLVGREIIEQIFAQPACAGMQILNGIDENGTHKLVFIGVDAQGKEILEYSVINANGELSKENGIVADRIRVGIGTSKPGYDVDCPDFSEQDICVD
jgi:sorbitol-specific phosphotransferase system component IIA